jgi:hypothetical protein
MCPSDMGNLSRCWLFCLGGVPCVLQIWVTSADVGYSVRTHGTPSKQNNQHQLRLPMSEGHMVHFLNRITNIG